MLALAASVRDYVLVSERALIDQRVDDALSARCVRPRPLNLRFVDQTRIQQELDHIIVVG